MEIFFILGILILIVIIITGLIIYFVYKKQNKLLNDELSGDSEFNLKQNNDSTLSKDNSLLEIVIPVELLPENTLNEKKLYEIKDSNVLARITDTVPALTNTLARTITNKEHQVVGEVYRAIIPSGVTLSKSKEMEGAFRGSFSKGKGIAGHANFVKVDPSQLSKTSQLANGVANVMNVTSLVVGQYYMSEVNDKLKSMNKNLTEIGDFQQREFKSKIFSLIARVGKISKFSSDIIENEELRNRQLHSLDSIEGKVIQLLQQVNITIDELSSNNEKLDFKTYSEKIHELNTLFNYQKVLVSLLEEISKLMYSLNKGAVKAEMCYLMFNGYLKQSNETLSKLELWHKIQTKNLGIDIDNHRIKKYGIQRAIGEVQGLFNEEWKYKSLDENIEKKIIMQTVNTKFQATLPEEVFDKDIEIVAKDGKLYYLK